MHDAATILSLFDEGGRYKDVVGEVAVIFLTQGGRQYPGIIRFKDGFLVGVAVEGDAPWSMPSDWLLDINFRLHFREGSPREFIFEKGRLVQNFEVEDESFREKFLTRLRSSRRLFASPLVVAANREVATSHEDILNRSDLWLTPKSVEWFNVAYFPELSPAQRDKIQSAVQAFRTVASQVPASEPATQPQRDAAARAFATILDVLAPFLSSSAEASQIEKAIETVAFPPWVVNWDYELGSSADDDPALWVKLIIDENVSRSTYAHFGIQIIPKIRAALEAEGVSRWPQIRFRRTTEYQPA